MAVIKVSEKKRNINNIDYVKNSLTELFYKSKSNVYTEETADRVVFTVECLDCYYDILHAEICDKLAEIVVVNYKYEYFKKNIKVIGLNETENEILFASIIGADLADDKKYVFDRLKNMKDIALDGVYNFRLIALKRKWQDIVSYIPTMFFENELKEFVKYLLENKQKKVYIENGKVYDEFYRRLKRCSLIPSDKVPIIREVILSNSGRVEITGSISKADEKYLKEFYGAKVNFNSGYFS